MEHYFGAWSVSYNKWTGPLEARAAALPEWAWSAAQRERWRDGREHTTQYAWFRYQPGRCEIPKRFAVRHRPEGEMFWRYAFLAVNKQDGSAQLAFARHRLKGEKERVLSELLSNLDLHHPPCANLNANRSFYTLAVLAWNLIQALKLLHLPVTEAPKRIRMLLRHLLLIPVELKRHARQLKVCLYAPAEWVAWWRGLLDELLPRCRLSPGPVASASG